MSKLDVKGHKNPYRSFVDCRTPERIAKEQQAIDNIKADYKAKEVEQLSIGVASLKDQFKKGYIPYD
jgi:hypothetical protein